MDADLGTEQDAAPVAPSVVAVVVTRDPGPWFEEVLNGLAEQDYPSLSILILDAASAVDPTPRVAEQLPRAFVRRMGHNRGYGVMANQVTSMVEGATFYLFCHDDVALAPNAVRLLVEEAFRSNAGVVGPKLVNWEAPEEILQVGMGSDKFAVWSTLAERGELDQEQHDAVRDVFTVPGGATLVRADLFEAIGGYDEGIDQYGEDVDLCWRAHLAGARVLVAPSALARHLEVHSRRQPDKRRKLQARHQLRTVLTNYGPFFLVAVLAQQLVLSVVEIVVAMLTGRTRQAANVVGAYVWNGARPRSILTKRRAVHRLRQVRDLEIRRLQVRGSARFNAFVRGHLGSGAATESETVGTVSRRLAGRLQGRSRQEELVVLALVLVVLAFGSRHLLTRELPVFGQFAAVPDDPGRLFAEWLGGFRSAGLGSDGPVPTLSGVLGALGWLAFGAGSLVRKVLILAPLALGIAGSFRLARAIGPSRAASAAAATYAVLPVGYNALANGSWSGVAVYGATPWIVLRMAEAFRAERRPSTDAASTRWWRDAVAIGLLAGLVGLVLPTAAILVVLLALSLALGSLLCGSLAGVGRVLLVGAGGAALGLALQFPWLAEAVVPTVDWEVPFAGNPPPGSPDTIGALLRFDSGPVGGGPLAWGFVIAGALSLLVGRSWRLAWAVRGWALAAAAWALLWVAAQGWSPVRLPAPEVLLAVAATGLSLAVSMSVASFELDIRDFGFGWRQLASMAAGAALVIAATPTLVDAIDGRWDVPRGGYERSFPFLSEEAFVAAPHRTLWLGDQRALPVGGWVLDGDLSYGITDAALPEIGDAFAGRETAETKLVSAALDESVAGNTNRLGRLLAPMAIRYIVVVRSEAPSPFGHGIRPAGDAIAGVLDEQLDLERVPLNSAFVTYQNTEWVPMRATIPASEADVATSDLGPFRSAMAADLGSAEAVLTERHGHLDRRGPLGDDELVLVSVPTSSRWELRVDGRSQAAVELFGWATGFRTDAAGAARLTYATPAMRRVLLAVQASLWFGLLALAAWDRRTEGEVPDLAPVVGGNGALGGPVVDLAHGEDVTTTSPEAVASLEVTPARDAP